MKAFFIVLLCSIVLIANAEDQIRIVRNGTNVTERPSAALMTNVIAYLESCSYYSTPYAVKSNTWQELERSDSFVLLTFASPRKLQVMMTPGDLFPRYREEKAIDQILVPLPETNLPLHVFAKSGTNVLSFTKMSPYVLSRIAFEPAVQLSSVRPYSSLARFLEDNTNPNHSNGGTVTSGPPEMNLNGTNVFKEIELRY
jgi:hypothetical protein